MPFLVGCLALGTPRFAIILVVTVLLGLGLVGAGSKTRWKD